MARKPLSSKAAQIGNFSNPIVSVSKASMPGGLEDFSFSASLPR
jgi:hypothetical protein